VSYATKLVRFYGINRIYIYIYNRIYFSYDSQFFCVFMWSIKYIFLRSKNKIVISFDYHITCVLFIIFILMWIRYSMCFYKSSISNINKPNIIIFISNLLFSFFFERKKTCKLSLIFNYIIHIIICIICYAHLIVIWDCLKVHYITNLIIYSP